MVIDVASTTSAFALTRTLRGELRSTEEDERAEDAGSIPDIDGPSSSAASFAFTLTLRGEDERTADTEEEEEESATAFAETTTVDDIIVDIERGKGADDDVNSSLRFFFVVGDEALVEALAVVIAVAVVLVVAVSVVVSVADAFEMNAVGSCSLVVLILLALLQPVAAFADSAWDVDVSLCNLCSTSNHSSSSVLDRLACRSGSSLKFAHGQSNANKSIIIV